MDKKILKYQQNCFQNYNQSLYLPKKYAFPDGNDIKPLPPIQVATNSLMIIGAYPSARFEYRKSIEPPYRNRLVPVANNLQPFADEQYFDGVRVRDLVSGRTINEYLLKPLDLTLQKCWITDLVKVFLYKETHAESCEAVGIKRRIPVLRDQLLDLGKKSLGWIQEEINLCKPKLIITLGYEVARVTSEDFTSSTDKLLSVSIYNHENLLEYPTIHAPHPDACRRNKKWRVVIENQITLIKEKLHK